MIRDYSAFKKVSQAFTAYWDDFRTITVMADISLDVHDAYTLTDGHLDLPVEVKENSKMGKKRLITLYVSDEYVPGNDYFLIHSSGESSLVFTGKVVRTEAFDDRYYYEGELGALLTETGTIFRVWAPTATEVIVNIYNQSFQKRIELPMLKQDRGVFECSSTEGEGTLYTYSVYVNGEWRETIDPYAKAATSNCKFGMVVNTANTNPENWDPMAKPSLEKPSDTIIYELHIRDFSSQAKSGLQNKGKYKAFTEEPPEKNGIPSGLNYIKWLGVTHVELLPIQDFGSVDEMKPEPSYNWGYDPIHYFVPEGSYSLNSHEPYTRIREVKEMIASFHRKGLRVIMDVVFNHVYQLHASNLEKIVPGYFFRFDQGGKPSNGTGVGNDTASERKMMRKLIIDSVVYWAKEFGVDGFRFDLMGIHDKETMNDVRYALDCIDPTILLFGEGWHMNTILPDHRKAMISHASEMPRIGFFNDHYRDSVKGKLFDTRSNGFATGNFSVKEEVKKCIMGSVEDYFITASQSINYVECHDNHTLWDRLNRSHPDVDEEVKKQMHRLATAITLLSQGIPFIHAGQEFFRTKNGVEDSYKSPDKINRFDWQRMRAVQENVKYVKGLIAIRKHFKAFRMAEVHDLKRITFLDSPGPLLAYRIDQDETNETMIVIHNGGFHSDVIDIGHGEKWILAEGDLAGVEPIRKTSDKVLTIAPFNTIVLMTND
ncbi:type I pullulanase [Alkalihalobacillus macyae]|uniref:type I pullulanase n=1 Tax=Guptibacillus hwajinpoensis TaxID=208199 RepID=UPI00273B29BE|nr:type I pullulanase [Alkalihalobacillus macyae]MDP4550983.1 type I pullulanase [Alkalihalobacillus macyae]